MYPEPPVGKKTVGRFDHLSSIAVPYVCGLGDLGSDVPCLQPSPHPAHGGGPTTTPVGGGQVRVPRLVYSHADAYNPK